MSDRVAPMSNVQMGAALIGAGAAGVCLAYLAARATSSISDVLKSGRLSIDHNVTPDARTLEALERFTASVQGGVGAIVALADTARTMFEDAFRGMSNGLRLASSFAGFVVFIYQVSTQTGRMQRAAAVAQFVNVLYANSYLSVPLNLVKECLARVAHYFSARAEGPGDNLIADLYYSMTQILAAIMDIKFTPPSNFIRDFNAKYTFVRNIRGSLETVYSICTFAAAALFKFVTGKELYPVTIQPVMDAVASLCSDMVDFILSNPRGLVCSDPSIYTKSLELYDRMRKMNDSLRSLKLSGYYLTDYNAACATFVSLHADLVRSVNSQAVRMEPVWVHLTGPAGTYKSSTVTRLVSVIAGAHGVPTDKVSFTKAASSDYYDGYSGQLIYREDDILVSCDVKDHQLTVERFIGLVNNQPLTLDMAAVDSKNAYSFVSEYVFSTSNSENLRGGSVASPEAWTRRQTLHIVPVPGTGPDDVKYRIHAIHGPTQFEYSEGDVIDFNALCDCVIKLHKHKKSVFASMSAKESELRELGARLAGVAQAGEVPPTSVPSEAIGIMSEDVSESHPLRPYLESLNSGDPLECGWINVCERVWVKPVRPEDFDHTVCPFKTQHPSSSSVLVHGIDAMVVDGRYFIVATAGNDVVRVAARRLVPPRSLLLRLLDRLVGSQLAAGQRAYLDWQSKLLQSRPVSRLGVMLERLYENKWAVAESILAFASVFVATRWIVRKLISLIPQAQENVPVDHYEPAQSVHGREDRWGDDREDRGKRVRVKAYGYNRWKRTPVSLGMAQVSVSSVETAQAVSAKIAKNMVRVGLGLTRDVVSTALTGIYLKDGWLLAPSHLFSTGFALDNPEEDVWLIVRTASGEVASARVPDVEFTYHDDKDFVLINFKTKHTFADITTHIPSRTRFHSRFEQVAVVKFDPLPSNRTSHYITTNVSTLERATYSGSGIPITCRELILVDSLTVPGDCGSPYIDYSDKAQARLVGMHVASINNRSAGVFLCREDFEDLGVSTPPQRVATKSRPMRADAFLATGKSQAGESYHKLVSMPMKTNITKSPVSDRLTATGHPPKYFPPDTSPEGLERTRQSILDRLTKVAIPLPAADYEEASRALLLMMPRTNRCGTLGMLDAINGTNTKHLKRIPMHTSPGLPYTLNPGSGKYPYFAVTDEGLLEPIPVVEQECTLLLDYLRNGEEGAEHGKPNPVAFVVHKDETLPLKDGHVKPQRPIVPNSIGLLIVGRMLFGQFQDVIMDDPARSPFSIGINPHSLQWGALGDRLRRGSYFDMDIKQQDASVALEDGLAFADMVSDYFGDCSEIRTMRRRFVSLLFEMPVIYAGKVFERGSGNPSGCAITQLLASYSSFCDVYSGFKAVFGLTPETFVSGFSVAFLGDDCAIGTDWDVSRFDSQLFAEHLAKYGRIVTSGDKKGLPRFTSDFSEVVYLSRTFRFDRGFTYAPMDVEDLYQPLHYLNTKHSNVTQTAASMIIEAFHHGKEFYDSFLVFVFQLLSQSGCALPPAITYGMAHDRFYSGTLGEDEFPWLSPKAQSGFKFTPAFKVAFREMYNVDPVEAYAEVLEDAPAELNLDGNPKMDVQEHSTSTAPDVVIEDKPAKTTAPVDLDPYKIRRQDVEKTYIVGEFPWSEADIGGTRLGTFVFPKDLTDLPNIYSRLQFYRYLSATLVVTFRVTSTRFHQGRLLVSWVPAYDRGGSLYTDPLKDYMNTTACCATISAGSSQSVTVRIPFSCGNPYLRWQEFDTLMAQFAIHVLLPLRSVTNSTTVSDARVMVYAAFEDVRVAGMIPQAVQFAQGPTSEQSEKSARGVVSGPLSKVSEVAKILTPLPVVGNVARITSFATGMVGKLAEALGFDKPTSLAAPTPLLNRSHQLMANCVGLDTATMLCMDPAYRTMASPAYFNSDVDEFRLSYLASLPSELKSFTFSDTAVSGDTVATWEVGPYTNDMRNLTWIAWASSFANLWRGSIVYRIGFTASAATRCRIRVAFQPYDTPRSVGLDVGSECVYADYDIVGDTDVTFVVPYVNDSIWTSVTANGFARVSRPTRQPGHIVVSVVNPICNMDGAVTTYIDASVWISAGPDFQLCYPISRAESMMYTPNTAEGLGRLTYGSVDVLGGGELIADPGIHSLDIVDSLLHLCHRYSLWMSDAVPNTTYRPFAGDLVTRCLAIRAVTPYMFVRGSVRYRLVPKGRLTGNLTVWCNVDDGSDGSVGVAKFQCDRDNDFVVQLPPFDTGRYFVNDVYDPAALSEYAVGVTAAQAYSVRFSYDGTETDPKFDIYLALGDDFSASWPKYVTNFTWIDV